jgi:hypothetical protein
MRKPVATSLAIVGLISVASLSSSAQQLRPPIGSDQATSSSKTTSTKDKSSKHPSSKVKSKRQPAGVGLDTNLTDPNMIKGLGEGMDASGQSILPPAGTVDGTGATGTTGVPGGSATVEAAGTGLVPTDGAMNPSANPVSGNVMFNSGNSIVGGATDILLNTQGGEPIPKTPLATVAPEKLVVSIEPAQVALNNLRGIQIIIKNNTDRPVVINGDMASVMCGGQKLQAASLKQIDVSTCPMVTPKEQRRRFAEATLSVGWIPTVEDQKIQNGPILARYGCDESRRINEISHFGRRVLWPGDSTGGVLYFLTDQSLKGLTIQLPVNTLFVNTDGALLTILP